MKPFGAAYCFIMLMRCIANYFSYIYPTFLGSAIPNNSSYKMSKFWHTISKLFVVCQKLWGLADNGIKLIHRQLALVVCGSYDKLKTIKVKMLRAVLE